MVRAILTILLPFLVPFVIFGFYAYFAARKRAKEANGLEIQAWENWPWSTLISAGGLCALVGLFVVFYDPNPPQEGVWVPPTVVDGEIVDGHFAPAPPLPEED